MQAVVKKPLISEKSMKLTENNFYSFEVDEKANKGAIAKFIENKFSVNVVNVRVVNMKPKLKMQKRTRKNFSIPGFKKAIVQTKKGQKIALFEAPKEEVLVTTGEGEPIVIKEKKNLLRGTKIKVEGNTRAVPTTQRKVITGK